MGRDHSRRLNLIAFVVLAIALLAGTGLRVHAQQASPNIQHDEAWSYASASGRLGPFLAAMDGGLTGRWVPASEWQHFWQSDGLSDVGRIGPDLAANDVHPPLYFGLLHGWLAITGQHVWSGRALNLVFAALAVLAIFGLGPRPRLRAARGRAGGARLGGEPGRGERLVDHPPVRPGGADDRPARLGAGEGLRRAARTARGRAAPAHLALARRALGGRRHRRGAAHALPGGAAGRRRRLLQSSPASSWPAGAAGAGPGGRRYSAWPPARSPRPCSRRAGPAPSDASAPSWSTSPRRCSSRSSTPSPRRSAGSSAARPSSSAAALAVVVVLLLIPRTRRGIVRRVRTARPGWWTILFFALFTAGAIILQNLLFLSMPPRISARYLAMAWPFLAFLPLLFFGLWPRARYALTAAFCLLVLVPVDDRGSSAARRQGPDAPRGSPAPTPCWWTTSAPASSPLPLVRARGRAGVRRHAGGVPRRPRTPGAPRTWATRPTT